ncbi:MAG TPA: LPS export ABC transporter ATP-binding protein [Gammaproteobacteria bacterium]|nr:LPS export ABC transporter ATP-binding protein [Gammaproteobacteria bacterium]
MSRLEARELYKSYGGRAVVDGVSLHVDSGEVVGLLGPNGAGKTTCFYMIVGLIPSDAGSVWLDEQELTRFPMHVRARHGVGYLPQEASVFRKLSVADNLMAVLELRKGLNRRERADRVEELLQELHIAHLRDQKGMSLSGGERRRVEIARALASEPRFILLDEPFAGVDPISVIDIQHIVEHLTERDIGVLITDHNVRETLGICNRAYILGNGQTLAEGPPEAILENQRVREVYLGDQFTM